MSTTQYRASPPSLNPTDQARCTGLLNDRKTTIVSRHKLMLKIVKIKFFAACIFTFSLSTAYAAPQWYQNVYAANTNNLVTLKDASNNSVSAITNPTAANVAQNSNTTTQPPTIVLQATATIPTVTIGTACINGKNTAALSAADNQTLLVCPPSNVWTITSRVALQTVVSGNACTIGTDGNLAVDSTGLPLSCQSGSWTASSGIVTAGGKTQLWKAIAGQSITCAISYFNVYAKVNGGGILTTRVTSIYGADSGWVSGHKASVYDGTTGMTTYALADLGGIIGLNITAGGIPPCSTEWT